MNNCFLISLLNKYYDKALITFKGCMKKKAAFRKLRNATSKDPTRALCSGPLAPPARVHECSRLRPSWEFAGKDTLPREKLLMYTKVAYHFKSHTWIFGSLIRRPVLDLELDIAFLKFKLNLMYITIAVLCVSHFSTLIIFSSYFLYFHNNLLAFWILALDDTCISFYCSLKNYPKT